MYLYKGGQERHLRGVTFKQTPESWGEVICGEQREDLFSPHNSICPEAGRRLVGLKWDDTNIGREKNIWNEVRDKISVRASLLEGPDALFNAQLSLSWNS